MLIGTNTTPVEVSALGASADIAVTPLPQPLAAGGEPPRVFLTVTDIEGDANPGIVFAVYLNLPSDLPPEDRSDYLAGIVSFFGIEQSAGSIGRQPPHGMRYSFDVTSVLERLRAQQGFEPERLTVSMVPTSQDEPETLSAAATPRVRVGTFSLYQQ